MTVATKHLYIGAESGDSLWSAGARDTAGKLGCRPNGRWKCPTNFSLSLASTTRLLPKAPTNFSLSDIF